jgi:ABC-type sugar transport system ATPase subunit
LLAEPLVEMHGIMKDFPGAHALVDCQFGLFPGEVHALVGEKGAGKSTLMKILDGVHKRDAVRHGIGYLPEDRKRYGLALGLNVETNIVLASLNRFLNRLGIVRTALTRAAAEHQVKNLAIKTPSTGSEGPQALRRDAAEGRRQQVADRTWATLRISSSECRAGTCIRM